MNSLTDRKREPLSWTPVRSGGRYCSPACGGGCTWSGYQYAVESSAALCAQLGEGWHPNVWENLGWNYCAVFKMPNDHTAVVHPSVGGKFYCLIGKNQTGHIWNERSGHFEDPRDAVRDELRCMLATFPFDVRLVTEALSAFALLPTETGEAR